MILTSIGLRAKTARAIAVILTGTADAPVAVARAELIFATPRAPALFQPYHEVLDLSWERAQLAVTTAESALVVTAAAELARLVREVGGEEDGVWRVGIVGAPNRTLERIASPHIRAHAAEGVLFRRILERAAEQNGLGWRAFREKGLKELASETLGVSSKVIEETVAQFGRVLGRPWRADEKAASIGAWLALADGY